MGSRKTDGQSRQHKKLVIGTRGSDLALWQAEHVSKLLDDIGLEAELRIIKTQGDQIQHLSLEKLEGKGFFTKEIEDALLAGETDIAVHSHKDLPTSSHEDLVIAAVSEREDPSELLIIRKSHVDLKKKFCLARKAVVGTSSARRKSQLLAFRPDVTIKDIRGNVPTRVQKLRDGEFDAILLASAGVSRLELDLSEFHVERLDCREFIPAPAQGVLAIQVRKSDSELIEKLSLIDNAEVRETIAIERRILQLFQGGCQMPVGVFAEYDDEKEMYSVRVCKAEAWDRMPVSVYSESSDPSVLAERVYAKINAVKPCSVFVTRNVYPDSYLASVMKGNGFEITGFPLIETVPVLHDGIPPSDWVFFASKQSVKYFFASKPDANGRKFGCVGKATAEELRKYGHRADFIGGGTDTKMIGKQFASRAGDAVVLFPQAKGSLRSVQQQFVKPSNVIDLVVYETLEGNANDVPEADIVMFTSPSNVNTYFAKRKLKPHQKVIAMGDATANALKQFRVVRDGQTDSFDEAGIARAIFSVSSIRKS